MTRLETCPVCHADVQNARVIHTRATDQLVRCPVCATLMATPQPSEEELKEVYRIEYYNEGNTRAAVDRKDEERVARVLHRAVLNDLLRRFPVLRPEAGDDAPRVLDYGCGPGYFL